MFTDKQIENFTKYKSVQEEGLYNMLSPQAAEAAGLTKEEHIFVMQHYSELQDAYERSK